MELDKAQAFIQDIYDTHHPVKHEYSDGTWRWDACEGEHYVSGYEWEINSDYEDNYCFLYKQAAEILGLPLAPQEKSPPRTAPLTEFESMVMKSYTNLVASALRPPPANLNLKEFTYAITTTKSDKDELWS